MLNIPQRYDLMNGSVVNTEVQKANEAIDKVCRRFRNVSLVDISRIHRRYHTRHGMHLNLAGKKFVSSEISKIINSKYPLEACTIPFITLQESGKGIELTGPRWFQSE
jgi:predicted metallo-beta-lactamase superfamily hydrolase